MNKFENTGYHGNSEDLPARTPHNGNPHIYKDNLENIVDPDSTDPYRELFGNEKEDNMEDEDFMPHYLLESVEE